MTKKRSIKELVFMPTAPGSWELEAVHFPHPVTLYLQEILPPAYKRGTRDYSRFFGLLSDGEELAFVNGYAYVLRFK